MPDSTYPDEYVEAVNTKLERLRRQAAQQGLIFVAGGDWNAVLGTGGDSCDNQFVGDHGMGDRNERGDMLAAFLAENMLSATNTYYPTQDSNTWTHRNGVRCRQIDFFCVCRRAKEMMTFSGAKDAIGVGADHRAVILCLKLPSEQEGGQSRKAAVRAGRRPSQGAGGETPRIQTSTSRRLCSRR